MFFSRHLCALHVFSTMANSTPADLPLTIKDIQDEAEKKLPQLYRCLYIPDTM